VSQVEATEEDSISNDTSSEDILTLTDEEELITIVFRGGTLGKLIDLAIQSGMKVSMDIGDGNDK
jgi:hypothetical protein